MQARCKHEKPPLGAHVSELARRGRDWAGGLERGTDDRGARWGGLLWLWLRRSLNKWA